MRMTLKLLPSLTMKFEENVILSLSNYSAPPPPDKIKNYIIKMAGNKATEYKGYEG